MVSTELTTTGIYLLIPLYDSISVSFPVPTRPIVLPATWQILFFDALSIVGSSSASIVTILNWWLMSFTLSLLSIFIMADASMLKSGSMSFGTG